ncbi:MAG: hypothetical protein WAK53_05555 [Chromatiaceae bacterium]|jgi:hypothetical protein
MKTLLAAIATAAFAAGAAAADDTFYHGWAEGNPDLLPAADAMESVVATQPGVGDTFDRYHGLEAGNDDLFGTPRDKGDQRFSKNPNVYGGFRGPSATY